MKCETCCQTAIDGSHLCWSCRGEVLNALKGRRHHAPGYGETSGHSDQRKPIKQWPTGYVPTSNPVPPSVRYAEAMRERGIRP